MRSFTDPVIGKVIVDYLLRYLKDHPQFDFGDWLVFDSSAFKRLINQLVNLEGFSCSKATYKGMGQIARVRLKKRLLAFLKTVAPSPREYKFLGEMLEVSRCSNLNKKFYIRFGHHRLQLAKHLLRTFAICFVDVKDRVDIRWVDNKNDAAGATELFTTRFKITLNSCYVCDPPTTVHTLLHQLCHVQVWGRESEDHGNLWNYWASRANLMFPGIQPITEHHINCPT